MFWRKAGRLVALALGAWTMATLAGCADATVHPLVRPPTDLTKPDMIIIHDFAVTPAEVTLDEGVMASAVRNANNSDPSAEEIRVGHMVADRLSQSLVDELHNSGIAAVRSSSAFYPTAVTAIITGEFITVNEGNQSHRVWVGFGLGASELRTHLVVVQNKKLVAEAETETSASLTPGMVGSAGSAAATGSATSLVTGAASAGVSETFLANVQADADRTAKEVAKKIRRAYVNRGWLSY